MKTRYQVVLAVGIVGLCATMPLLVASSTSGGQVRTFFVKARQYAYDPGRITVNQGDEVRIRLVSLDVVHGFFLEGYDIDALVEPGAPVEEEWPRFKMRRPSEGKEYSVVQEIVFKADRRGKFRYRCSHTCGTMHPFMQGELIVEPNYPYQASTGAMVGLVIAVFAILYLRVSPHPRIHKATPPRLPDSEG